jgi:hypothetical protein
MLLNKNTTILSEIKEFFTSSEKASNAIFDILHNLKIPVNRFNLPNDIRNFYLKKDVIMLMLLFPMLQIRNAYDYCKSPVYYLFSSGKDVFYRLKNNQFINWRLLGYSLTLKLIHLAEKRGEKPSDAHSCLIIDDTDLPKTGLRIELIGRVWSHVINKSRLGFKGLFMGYHDGKSFYGLDFSLHGEEGNNPSKPYGLSKKQLKTRYSKKRNKKSEGYQRIQEYYQAKTHVILSMIRTAITKGLRFEYILVDSWFVCEGLIRFVHTRKIGCELLGMAKMGNAKYTHKGNGLTAKEIIDGLKRKKKVKKSKLLNVWYACEVVEYKGMLVKLFFCKTTCKGKWSVLLSTNSELEFEQAYRIYATRWAIEVFFKESKQYFGLGKSQSQNFDAQIADTTISMLQYNTLSFVKRFIDYETMGELFRQTKTETLMLTIAEQIWKYLIEILQIIVEIFEIEMDEIIEKLVEENLAIIKLINLENFKNTA